MPEDFPPSSRRAARASVEDHSAPENLEEIFAAAGGPRRREKGEKKSRVGLWVVLSLLVILVGGIAAVGYWAWSNYEGQIRELMGWEEPKDFLEGEANGEVLVTVVSGDTGQSISRTLFNDGVTKTPDAFYDMLVDSGENPPFEPGVFRLQLQMTSTAALAALLDSANRMSNTAQIREGLTVAQSLPILAESLQLPLEDFVAAAATPATFGVDQATLEGWLFPATYTFDPGVSASDVLSRLVTTTVESLDRAAVPVERRQEILTIASIIQREGRTDDFGKVSRVIQNRLLPGNVETFGKLEMDSTAQYGYGEMHDGTVSSSAEALADPNLWNTYVHAGLPIGPIANPGDAAIYAAMNPDEGPWMYFVTVNIDTGETVFTSTYAEHEVAVEQWRSWCRDNPDSGC